MPRAKEDVQKNTSQLSETVGAHFNYASAVLLPGEGQVGPHADGEQHDVQEVAGCHRPPAEEGEAQPASACGRGLLICNLLWLWLDCLSEVSSLVLVSLSLSILFRPSLPSFSKLVYPLAHVRGLSILWSP